MASSAIIVDIDLGKSWLGHERMHPEVEFMRAELATHARRLRRRHGPQSSESIPKQPFRAYALFNLGVAMRAAGALERSGSRRSRRSARWMSYSADALDLKQRAPRRVVGSEAPADAVGVGGVDPRRYAGGRPLSRSCADVLWRPRDGQRRLRTRRADLAVAEERRRTGPKAARLRSSHFR